MVCPYCKHSDTQVLDSRDGPDGVRRRRECLKCKNRFTTYERTEVPQVIVIKKNGDKERFDQEKVRKGVKISCKNRPVTSAQIDNLVNEVTQRVIFSGKEEIDSKDIGTFVQTSLQELDPIAYLRFTSVYQAFANLNQFEQEINNIH